MRGFKKALVGVDIGASSVKAAELKNKRGKYELMSLGLADLQPDTIVDGQIIDYNLVSDAIAKIFEDTRIKNRYVATSVSGHSVIAKKLTLPVMGDAELDEQIRWEAEQHIPFAISDVNLYYEILERSPDGQNMDVLLVACKRDKIQQCTQVLSQAGRQPLVIDVDAFALQNCYEINYHPAPETAVALLDIGAAVMTINILKGTNSIFTRDVSIGGNHYTDLLQKEMNLTFEEAEAIKRGVTLESGLGPDDAQPLIQSVTEILGIEIQKTLDFYRSTVGPDADRIDRMLISGGGCKVHGLAEYLANRFGFPVELFDPFRDIRVNPKRFDQEYLREVAPSMVIAVGLAVRTGATA